MRTLIRAIYVFVILYTAYVLYYLYQEDFVARVMGGRLSDFISALYILVFPLSIYLADRLRRNSSLRESEKTIVIFSAVVIIFFVLMFSIYDQSNKSPIAILAAGFFATCGWIYTSHENRANSRKAHTLNILLQMRGSQEYSKHKSCIIDNLPENQKISNYIINDIQQKYGNRNKLNIRESVIYVTNYFEFICAGYISGDLDEKILLNTMGSIIVNYYNWVEPFINESRLNDEGYRNPLIYRNLEDTVDIFKRKRQKAMRRYEANK